MDKSYKFTVTKDAAGVPTGVATVEEVSLLSGLISRTINFDNDIVYQGPVHMFGRLTDAALGAVVEHRVKNGFFAVPFVKMS